jgi:hypothetical protein
MSLTQKTLSHQPAGEPCPGYVVSPTLAARQERIVAREGFWCPLCEGTHYLQDTSRPDCGRPCPHCHPALKGVRNAA